MPPPSPLSTLPSHLRMHMIIAVLQPPWASRRVPAWRRARLRLEGLKGRAEPVSGAPSPPPPPPSPAFSIALEAHLTRLRAAPPARPRPSRAVSKIDEGPHDGRLCRREPGGRAARRWHHSPERERERADRRSHERARRRIDERSRGEDLECDELEAINLRNAARDFSRAAG